MKRGRETGHRFSCGLSIHRAGMCCVCILTGLTYLSSLGCGIQWQKEKSTCTKTNGNTLETPSCVTMVLSNYWVSGHFPVGKGGQSRTLSGSGSDRSVLWASSETLAASVDAWATGRTVVPGGQKRSLAWAADPPKQPFSPTSSLKQVPAVHTQRPAPQLPRGPPPSSPMFSHPADHLSFRAQSESEIGRFRLSLRGQPVTWVPGVYSHWLLALNVLKRVRGCVGL